MKDHLLIYYDGAPFVIIKITSNNYDGVLSWYDGVLAWYSEEYAIPLENLSVYKPPLSVVEKP